MPSVWTILPADKSLAPQPSRVTSATDALEWAANAIHDGKKRASKDRVDLAALKAHTGTTFAQVELVPQSLFETVRELRASVSALVLLPPGAGAGTVAATDAVALLYDASGALKGLPANERATMVAKAAGVDRVKLFGEVVLARLLVKPGEPLALGSEASAQFMVERDWLEAAQAANKAGVDSGFETYLQSLLDEGRKRAIGAAVAAAAAPAVAPVAAAAPAAAPAADMATLGELKFSDAGDDATATVRVPDGTKARDVKCIFKDERLKLEVATLPAGATCVIDGDLFQKVRPDGCNFTLEDTKKGRILTLTLEKATKMTWLMLIRSGVGAGIGDRDGPAQM